MEFEARCEVDREAGPGSCSVDNDELKEIFGDICDLPADARIELLAARSGDDVTLRRAVEELLKAYDEAGPFLASPGRIVAANHTVVGQRIDHYLIIKEIGEGGFGTVYIAEQQSPVRRRVALKIIKLGMDTKAVIARFDAERQALAMMDHPNVARIYDAGATESGRPYFVMELLDGVPINAYCDANHLPLRQRLELFVPVCQAIQHAHQKGLIHRDLKPSNVLVTIADGRPVPKVIDFGIAKAIQARLTEATLFTESGQMIGTPEYMSPEQAGNKGIDTRSDVYSLGVLLYELMTGTTPLDARSLRTMTYAEMQQRIQDLNPAAPSMRVSAVHEALPTTTAQQSAEARQLNRCLRNELDWIVMKSLEKDRDRRYATASELSDDIRRHLNNEPVEACPPGMGYRLGKWLRRHREFAGTITALLAIAIASIAIYIHGIRIEQRKTNQALVDAQAQRTEAVRRRDEAQQATARANQEQIHSAIVQARAGLSSIQAGRRFDSLRALEAAAQIQPTLQLRSQAIASMALADLRIAREWRGTEPAIDFNHSGTMYADCSTAEEMLIHRTPAAGAQPTAPILRLPGGKSEPHVTFSPDDQFIAIGRTDGHLEVFSINGNRLLNVQGGPGCDFMPDGSGIATAMPDGVVAVFDLPSGHLRWQFRWRATASIAVSPDGQKIAMWNTFNLVDRLNAYVGDLTTGRMVTLPHPDQVCAAAWHPRSNILATATANNKSIHLWNIEDPDQVQNTVLKGHDGLVCDVAFAHGGDLLASCSWDGTVRLWDTVTGQEQVRLLCGAFHLHFTADDSMLLVTDGIAGDHIILQVATGRERRSLLAPLGSSQREVVFNSDGNLMACGGDRGVRFWNLTDPLVNPPAVDAEVAPHCHSVAFSPDGTCVVAIADSGIWRLPLAVRGSDVPGPDGINPVHLRIAPKPDQINARPELTDGRVHFSSDGKRLFVADWLRPALILSLNQPDAPTTLTGSESAMFMSVSPDDKWIATGTWQGTGDRRVSIWDGSTGHMLTALPFPQDATVQFSPDRQWLVTAGLSEVRFWETGSWSPGRVLPREQSQFNACAFSPDSRLLAFPHRRDGVRLLDVQTGAELATFDGEGRECPLSFSPDGELLVTMDVHQVIHLWNLRMIRAQLALIGLDWPQPPMPVHNSKPAQLLLENGTIAR